MKRVKMPRSLPPDGTARVRSGRWSWRRRAGLRLACPAPALGGTVDRRLRLWGDSVQAQLLDLHPEFPRQPAGVPCRRSSLTLLPIADGPLADAHAAREGRNREGGRELLGALKAQLPDPIRHISIIAGSSELEIAGFVRVS